MAQPNNDRNNLNSDPIIDTDINNGAEKNKFNIKNKFVFIPLIVIAVFILYFLGYFILSDKSSTISKTISKQSEENKGNVFLNLI